MRSNERLTATKRLAAAAPVVAAGPCCTTGLYSAWGRCSVQGVSANTSRQHAGSLALVSAGFNLRAHRLATRCAHKTDGDRRSAHSSERVRKHESHRKLGVQITVRLYCTGTILSRNT